MNVYHALLHSFRYQIYVLSTVFDGLSRWNFELIIFFGADFPSPYARIKPAQQ